MNLRIKTNLEIPANEIQWRFSRSSGAGGQNVNKTESRVEISFNVAHSKALSPYQKYMISVRNDVKLINGCICIAVQDKRTQYQNRQLALNRLASTLRELLKHLRRIEERQYQHVHLTGRESTPRKNEEN